ncbi:hypothetical protein C8R44DRAFT_730999 [Mycena epipterygia]|nr:hypothetical protein C8R44DRAFT_730999 [Mycena epipterygia]
MFFRAPIGRTIGGKHISILFPRRTRDRGPDWAPTRQGHKSANGVEGKLKRSEFEEPSGRGQQFLGGAAGENARPIILGLARKQVPMRPGCSQSAMDGEEGWNQKFRRAYSGTGSAFRPFEDDRKNCEFRAIRTRPWLQWLNERGGRCPRRITYKTQSGSQVGEGGVDGTEPGSATDYADAAIAACGLSATLSRLYRNELAADYTKSKLNVKIAYYPGCEAIRELPVSWSSALPARKEAARFIRSKL